MSSLPPTLGHVSTVAADPLLDGLNPQQRAAVVHEGTPLLIVAGAGSGKTRVLTYRIAYLLAHRHVSPSSILAITFTNKAAGEMASRVAALVGNKAKAMWVMTFHSACVRILRREAKRLGYPSSFSISDQDQATTHAQDVLVRELVGRSDPAELCVVGDADQCIYAFRGATIRNIEEFEQDYPDAKVILLEQNYRSTQNILSAANAVVSRNAGRKPKNLWSDQGAGPLITGYVADNEHDEAAFVAAQVDRRSDEGEAVPGPVAGFYRP